MKNTKMSIFYVMIIITTTSGIKGSLPDAKKFVYNFTSSETIHHKNRPSSNTKDQNNKAFDVETREISATLTLWQASLQSRRNERVQRKELDFQICLNQNRLTSDLGPSGLPKVCEKVAAAFAIYHGYSALEEKVNDYNKTRKLMLNSDIWKQEATPCTDQIS